MVGGKEGDSHSSRKKDPQGFSNLVTAIFFYLYIDMAFKLYSLNESFRKYQMEDLECQMYVACEAGKQLHGENHEDFGSLTKRIHKIFK